MKKRRTIRYYIGRLHLWLGLASGLVVLIVSITGCLFVFQQEISQVTHPEWYYVKIAASTPALPLSRLQQIAQTALGPDKPIGYIVTYRDHRRSWEFMAFKETDDAITIFGSMIYFQSVFVDPYTGEVTGTRNYKYDFFNIVKYIHWSLLLNTPYGQPIVCWGTVIFVIMLITGLVLWWPKKWTKTYKDRSFKIKWKASFRRVNYDLHNVPGFYTLIPALILGLTGLVFWVSWFNTPPAISRSIPPRQQLVRPADTATAMDKAFVLTEHTFPRAPRIAVSPAAGAEAPIVATAYPGSATYYDYDVLQLDRYTGRLLSQQKNSERSLGQRLIEMNYDIHVGAIGGLTGKIIAFFVSLICASLPVTGFLVWWNKRKRPSRQTQVLTKTSHPMV